jgi:hypothetical protein
VYNTIINFKNVADIPLEIKEILESQRKIGLSKLETSLPVITDYFTNVDIVYKYQLEPKLYANFLLEYLASIMLDINKESHEKYKVMAGQLISYFTNMIVAQEILFSKARAIFSKTKEDITKGENDTDEEDNISDYAGYDSDESEDPDAIEDVNENYKNEIDNDGYDVENADDIWENE